MKNTYNFLFTKQIKLTLIIITKTIDTNYKQVYENLNQLQTSLSVLTGSVSGVQILSCE